jgi:N-methylhydantoinase A/oxoprolinase/acetone carboxylase beta subunit
MPLTLGIDTGGTYTDAVLVDDRGAVAASAKALTTHEELARGIGEVLDSVMRSAGAPVGLVSVSTTLATNAVVEGEGQPVALLLVGQGREALERGGLGAALGRDAVVFVDGGHDGSGNELAPLDIDGARAAIDAQAPQVSAFAIAAHFSVRNPAHERRLQRLVEERTGLPVSCGHQLSHALDAPRRALTALLNARLIPLLTELITAVRGLLEGHGIEAPLMVVRGDGSLVGADVALRAPVDTILSGPAASLVGARHLAGEPDAVVVDIGGTTSDIGLVERGEARRHREGARIGGWRTRVDAVDVHTIGLGGDSEVHLHFDPPFTVGPRRVVPLAQLAARFPRVLTVLERQAAEPRMREHAGAFVLRRREPRGGGAALTRSQRALWERLGDGPVDLVTLFAEQTRQRALDRLVEQGIVALAGFTPTDAAHILGRQDAWDTDAAHAGAAILAARAWDRWGRRLGPPESLAARVHDAVTENAARGILGAALAGTGAAPDGVPAAGTRALIDAAIGASEVPAAVDPVLAPRYPLVVVGAAADTYADGIAERLRARRARPQHAHVANAVGAVVAGVIQRVTATITPLADERYRVHTPHGISTFPTLEQAGSWAEGEAARLARERAAAAGAPEPEVELDRRDTVGHTEDGYPLFFEATITATARGRPAAAAPHVE